MKCSQILRDLSKENEDLKKIISNIHSRFTVSDKGVLEGLCKVSYILYIIRDVENSLLITERLSLIPFNNDYDYWTWIEFAISLKALIAKNEGQNQIFDESLEKINSALNHGEGLVKKVRLNVHQRFMAGEGVNIDELKNYNNLSLADDFDYRLIYLMKLIKIKVLGGSPEYPVSKALDEMVQNISAMKELLKDVSLNNVEPFHQNSP